MFLTVSKLVGTLIVACAFIGQPGPQGVPSTDSRDADHSAQASTRGASAPNSRVIISIAPRIVFSSDTEQYLLITVHDVAYERLDFRSDSQFLFRVTTSSGIELTPIGNFRKSKCGFGPKKPVRGGLFGRGRGSSSVAAARAPELVDLRPGSDVVLYADFTCDYELPPGSYSVTAIFVPILPAPDRTAANDDVVHLADPYSVESNTAQLQVLPPGDDSVEVTTALQP